MMKKLLLTVGAISLAATLVACNDNGEATETEEVEQGIESPETAVEQPDIEELLDAESVPDPVATVNGTDISRDDYVMTVEQQLSMLMGFGVDLQGEEGQQMLAMVEQSALDQLINDQLLIQAADEAGLEATEEEIQQEIDLMIAELGSEEALEEALAENNFTMDELREDINLYVMQAKFVEERTETVEVTEEELEALYEEQQALYEDELPPFEEYRAELEAQIESERSEEQILVLIEELRTDSEINVNI